MSQPSTSGTMESHRLDEMVIAAQFQRIPHLGAFHLYQYCSSLGGEWEEPTDVPPLGRVDVANPWSRALIEFAPFGRRVRIRHRTTGRTIQVENGWFVYGWTRPKDGSLYPRFDVLKTEFLSVAGNFMTLLKHGIGVELKFDLWELAYINKYEHGVHWNNAAELGSLLPRLLCNTADLSIGTLEALNCSWIYDNASDRNKVYVQAYNSVTSPTQQTFVLSLMARGTPLSSSTPSLQEGFEGGHRLLLNAFREIREQVSR